MKHHWLISLLLMVPAAYLLNQRAVAEEKTWTGAVDGSWTNNVNWAPPGLVDSVDAVLYDSTSLLNLSQTLDQNWSITGLRVTNGTGPITIAPGAGAFVLTNLGTIDISNAAVELTVLADYYPGTSSSGFILGPNGTLTVSNIVGSISDYAIVGAGTVRLTGSSGPLMDELNASTLVVDGGSITGNPPVRLSADAGAIVTVLVTNNGAVRITSGSSTRIRLGGVGGTLTPATNRFILDGGTVTVTGSASSSANGIFVGDSSGTVGILDLNNGTVDLTDRNDSNARSVLRLGNSTDSVGIVNLNANARLLTPRVDRISGVGIFNFNGGYFRASTTADYFDSMDQVNILSGGALVDTLGGVVGFLQSLAGPGGLTKMGSGSLLLAGTNNTYAGPTVISNGTFGLALPMSSSSLNLGSNVAMSVTVGVAANASWPANSVALQASNTLTFSYGAESKPSATLLSTPALSAVGTNVINIAGAGWPVGTTHLIDYSGSIAGGGQFVLGSLPVGLNARLTNDTVNTSLDLVVSSGVNNLDWYGYAAVGPLGGGLWDIATTFNWNNGAAIYNEYGSGLGDSVRFTPLGNPTVELDATVRPSAVVISNLNTGPYTLLGTGKISGPTSLVKQGNNASSVLEIQTTNDYTGGTYLQLGILRLGAHNALPTNGIFYLGSPGNGVTFTLNGFNQTLAGLVSTGSGSGNRRLINGGANACSLVLNIATNLSFNYNHTIGNNSLAQTDPANNFDVVKTGDGLQIFSNNDAHAGGTVIQAGTLLFNGNGSFPASGLITVRAGGTVGGTAFLNAPIVVQPGGRLQPGNLTVGTLTVTNSVTLQGETVMELNRSLTQKADRLNVVGNSIIFGGLLTVTNIGPALQAGDAFSLFGGTFNGTFAAISLPPLSPILAWDTNSLYSAGTISVVALPIPSFATPVISGGNFLLSGSGGPTNGTFYVLTSTNVAAPFASWSSVATNAFNATGAFNISLPMDAAPQRFYLLQLP